MEHASKRFVHRETFGNIKMATIALKVDNIDPDIWWLIWIEKNEVIGKIVEDGSEHWRVMPQGPHWSPMKSFAGNSFKTPQSALMEIQIYFAAKATMLLVVRPI